MPSAGIGNLLSDSKEGRDGFARFVEDFRKQVAGFGLTTAHILYRRPDHRWLLQSYVWQAYDLFPEFPELQSFWRSGRRSWKARCIRCRSRIAS